MNPRINKKGFLSIKKIIIIAIVIILITLSVGYVAIEQESTNKTYEGILTSTGYPPISENIPLCLVFMISTGTTRYYLTENEVPICAFGDFSKGDNVKVIGHVHYLYSYLDDTEFKCIEIETMTKI